MPAKPIWYTRLDTAIEQLEALPSPWVDRAALEWTLGVGRRRAQQILEPLVRQTIGKNGLADREEVIRHLRALAAGEAVSFEIERRDRLHSILNQLHPRMKGEPTRFSSKPRPPSRTWEFEALPPGVHLSPGRIRAGRLLHSR